MAKTALHPKGIYDPLAALNMRLTSQTEEIIRDEIEDMTPIREIEEAERHEAWLLAA